MSDDPLEHVPCGLLSFVDNGTVLRTNKTLRTVLGFSAEELEGRTVETVLTIASRLFFQTHLLPLLRLQGYADEVSLTLLSRAGEPIPFLVNAHRRDLAGEVRFDCALMVYRERHRFEADIFAAKHAAEKALAENQELVAAKSELETYSHDLDRQISRSQQRSRELARVSQVLAHDLSEPARKLQLFADYLKEDVAQHISANGLHHLKRIQAEGARIQYLIKNLQAFLMLEPEPGTTVSIELEPLLRAAAKEVAEQNQGGPLELVCEPLPALEGYREDLETLFHHLLHALSLSDASQPIYIESCILKENVFKSIPDKYHYDDAVRLIFRVKSLRFDLRQMEDFLTKGTKLTREWEQVSFNFALCRKLIDHHRGSLSLATSPEGQPQVTVLLPLRQ